jgi:hypothetical protein
LAALSQREPRPADVARHPLRAEVVADRKSNGLSVETSQGAMYLAKMTASSI